ncbi:unnamed protein product [Microthlaspi erraticum]|uniref:F-box associated beta-propeller type 3 domain-containing protein n=1 Tax=Microthlaspi erraticum TaxID=1685480 RepID=A0A6D2JW04_9BRAS|nr:unnamed protein product [Microthlaspi erraticum]
MKTRRQNSVSGDPLPIITRRNTRSKTAENSSWPIPIDVIIEIFSTLPLESIATCRCVSKLCDLLFFSSPQPQNPDENSSSVVANIKFSVHGSRGDIDYVHGLVSLLCNQNSRGKEETLAVICNPSTRESVILPKVKMMRGARVKCLLGYDPIDKQFKVLSMTKGDYRLGVSWEKHQVLTLGTGGKPSWRKIECPYPIIL